MVETIEYVRRTCAFPIYPRKQRYVIIIFLELSNRKKVKIEKSSFQKKKKKTVKKK